jgi:hypothetical protein
MKQNFDLRRALYGDACTGVRSLYMAELATKLGLTAKLTGSGGAAVCIRNLPVAANGSASKSSASSSVATTAAGATATTRHASTNQDVHSFFSIGLGGGNQNGHHGGGGGGGGYHGNKTNSCNISDYLFTEDEEAAIRKSFNDQGYEFVKVLLPNPLA